MTDVQERRSPGSNRVTLDTLVEICGNEMGTPAFEAEALDVSARGMHLRTAYLPEEGAPLVCRFEDHGREIVVEGVVAWRKESKKGGDFGVKFTALDSRSVDSLRELVKRDIEDQREASDETARGSRVRLHIEGLGSPMKARVRTGGVQKVQVGSNLEFLKVGRKLEIEDLEAGGRREARIDGVEVVVDPQSSVPQLVVALRYEGVEDTPEPSVLDLGGEPAKPASLFIDAGAVTTDARATKGPVASDAAPARSASSAVDAPSDEPTPSGDAPAASDDDVDDAIPTATRAARRLGTAAEHAGEKAREASIAAAKFGSSALSSVGKLFGSASEKIAALRAGKQGETKRRTTAPPPEGPVSLEGKRLRPQTSKRDGETAEAGSSSTPERKTKKQRTIAAVAGVAVLGAVLAFAARPGKPDAEKTASAATAPQAPTTAAAPATAGAAVSPPGAPVTANVPLFGPTPMATAEPAPLGPPPTAEGKAVEAAELAAATASAPESAEDEEFTGEPASKSARKPGDRLSKDAKPEDVPAWGRGKMHLPTIHRVRLDGPGSAIHGAVDPMGFTVLIPSRKVMEQGAGLAKRDTRFARVRTTNTPGGAQVRIAFKSTVPAYRVRLRRDYIELLISATEESKDKPKAAAKEATRPAATKPAAAKAKPAAKIGTR